MPSASCYRCQEPLAIGIAAADVVVLAESQRGPVFGLLRWETPRAISHGTIAIIPPSAHLGPPGRALRIGRNHQRPRAAMELRHQLSPSAFLNWSARRFTPTLG